MVTRVTLNPANQKAFSFTADSKELDAVLSRLGAAVGLSSTGSKSFIAIGVKGKVVILAFNTDTYVYIELANASSTGDGAFGFDPVYLQGIVKGRSQLSFTFTGNECEFKLTKGKYNGKFVVLPVTNDQATSVNTALSAKDKGTDTTLNREVLDALKEGLSLTSIKDIYADNSLLSYLNLSTKGLFSVACFDQHHFGHYVVKAEQKGVLFKIALPSSHFLTIDKLVGSEDAKFFIRSESIRIEGTNFVLVLPSSQTEDKNYTIVPDYIKSLDKPDFKCTIDLARLTTTVDNLFTIYSANTSFELTFKEGQSMLGVTFTTNHGSASDSIKVDVSVGKAIKALIEPRMLKDVLTLIRSQGEATLSLKKQKWLRIDLEPTSGATVSYVCSLAG